MANAHNGKNNPGHSSECEEVADQVKFKKPMSPVNSPMMISIRAVMSSLVLSHVNSSS